MRHFLIDAELSTGHKPGEVVSDIRLSRAEIPELLAAGSIKEIDAASLKFLAAPKTTAAAGVKPVASVPAAPAASGPPRKLPAGSGLQGKTSGDPATQELTPPKGGSGSAPPAPGK
jgi:hypothetical protein